MIQKRVYMSNQRKHDFVSSVETLVRITASWNLVTPQSAVLILAILKNNRWHYHLINVQGCLEIACIHFPLNFTCVPLKVMEQFYCIQASPSKGNICQVPVQILSKGLILRSDWSQHELHLTAMYHEVSAILCANG